MLVVPTACPANVTLAGLTLAGAMPVPVREAVGFTVESVVTVRVPLRLPVLAGVKNAEMVQEAPDANVAGAKGQLVVVVKSARLV